MNIRTMTAVAAVLSVAAVAGCGGGGGQSAAPQTTISGTVADGYLFKAEVFLDRNGNYQQDSGEPATTTDVNGRFSLAITPGEEALYPVVARAVGSNTYDMDAPAQPLTQGYILTAPRGMHGFISPISTLLREKYETGNYASVSDAMHEIRQQLGLTVLNPASVVLSTDDFVALSGSTNTTTRTEYQRVRTVAGVIADLMAGQISSDAAVNVNRYRYIMGRINLSLPQLCFEATQSANPDVANMRTRYIGTIPGTFVNMTGMFRNMTTTTFWNLSGSTMVPRNRGGMMR